MGWYEDMERAEQERDAQEYECAMAFNDGYNKAIDEFAEWLVEQGILGNRVISDGEITDYGKVYAKKFKQQMDNSLTTIHR